MNSVKGDTVLSVRDLEVTIAAKPGRVPVVDGVSFDLAAGEILGLVGESGCGKSITAAALMGMVPAPAVQSRAQSIKLGETELAELDEDGFRNVRGREISMIFQEPLTALDPVFTIGSQLTEVIRRHRKLNRKMAYQAAVSTLEYVGLAEAPRMMKNYPHQLSGGMRQRVMIGMAMVCKPRVLLADEPTTALDVTTQRQILDQLWELSRSSGTAILLITHDLGVVARVCDRVLVMYCGRIVEEAPVRALFDRTAHPYTAGLMSAVPRVSRGEVSRVRPIPGNVPNPADLPAGCHFAARCPRTITACHVQVPSLQSTRVAKTEEAAANRQPEPGTQPRDHQCACHNPVRAGS
jgi:oligopeptide/dipeptide ABC transporter ATP-binding protein